MKHHLISIAASKPRIKIPTIYAIQVKMTSKSVKFNLIKHSENVTSSLGPSVCFHTAIAYKDTTNNFKRFNETTLFFFFNGEYSDFS